MQALTCKSTVTADMMLQKEKLIKPRRLWPPVWATGTLEALTLQLLNPELWSGDECAVRQYISCDRWYAWWLDLGREFARGSQWSCAWVRVIHLHLAISYSIETESPVTQISICSHWTVSKEVVSERFVSTTWKAWLCDSLLLVEGEEDQLAGCGSFLRPRRDSCSKKVLNQMLADDDPIKRPRSI